MSTMSNARAIYKLDSSQDDFLSNQTWNYTQATGWTNNPQTGQKVTWNLTASSDVYMVSSAKTYTATLGSTYDPVTKSFNFTAPARVFGNDGDNIINGIDLTLKNDGLPNNQRTPVNNALFGGAGDDTINGASGDDVLSGGTGKDQLFGGSGNDQIAGGKNEDILHSGKGMDTLYGGSGDDTLYSEGNTDKLYGGTGADKFVASGGKAYIQDFNPKQGDTVSVDLSKYSGYTKADKAYLSLSVINGDLTLTGKNNEALVVIESDTSQPVHPGSSSWLQVTWGDMIL